MAYEPRLKRRRGEFSKLVIMLSYLILLCSMVVMFWCFLNGVYIPDAFIYAVFGFFGTEMVAVAWRTKNKEDK